MSRNKRAVFGKCFHQILFVNNMKILMRFGGMRTRIGHKEDDGFYDKNEDALHFYF